MKKLLALLLTMGLLLLCACGSEGAVPRNRLPENRGMYDLSACFPDMHMLFGDQNYTFEGNGLCYKLTIRNCLAASWTPPLANHEVHIKDGLTYYTKNTTLFWDGVDENGNGISGEDEINEVVLVDGNYYYILNGHSLSDQKTDASIELLLELLSNKLPEGIVMTRYSSNARLSGAYGEYNISLSAYEEDQWVDRVIEEQMTLHSDGGASYVRSPVTQTSSGRYVCEYICGTGEGLLRIRGGVPEDDPNYLNIKTVRTVAKALNTRLTDLPQVYLDLYE